APSYVERSADSELFAALRHGEFCYVLTSRQMGKSSLMVRAAGRMRGLGTRVALLDVTSLGQMVTPEQWYLGMLLRLGSQLGCSERLRAHWDTLPELGPVQRWFAAVERVLLQSPVEPEPAALVLFIDEIDAVRSLPFSTDEFFAAIRGCYNRRAEEPALRHLTFCLLGVASPAELIRDPHTTPFNIGRRIELQDFTPEEAAPLARGLAPGAPEQGSTQSELLARVLYWTGGHPYLTQRLCRALVEAADQSGSPVAWVDRVCGALFLTAGARQRDDNLLHLRERLLRSHGDLTARLELLRQSLRGVRFRDAEDDPVVEVLRISGVVRLDGAVLRIRNRIYERCFDRAWLQAQMPGAELRRQRAAFQRGLLRAGAAASVVVALVGSLALSANQSEARARTLTHRLERQVKQQAATLAKLEAANARARREARAAQLAKRGERRQRLGAESARSSAVRAAAAAEAQRRTAVRFQHAADQERELSRRRLVRAHVAAGMQRAADGDPYGGLLRYVEALRIDPADAPLHRLRIGAVLAQGPRLTAIHRFPRLPNTPISLRFSPDGARLVSLVGDEIHVYHARTGRELGRPLLASDGLDHVVFAPDSRQVLHLGSGTARLWAPETGTVRRMRVPTREFMGTSSFTRDGRTVAIADGGGNVWVCEAASGRLLAGPLPHPTEVGGLDFSPDGSVLATAGRDRLRLWDWRKSGLLPTQFPGSGGEARVRFSVDGRRLLKSGARAGIWDAADGRQVALVPEIVTSEIITSPEGTQWAIADHRGVRIASTADAGGGRPRLDAGSGLVTVSLGPEGSVATTLTEDGALRTWDTASGAALMEPVQLSASARAAAFSPGGQELATLDALGTLRIWDLAPRGLPRRSLTELTGGAAPWRVAHSGSLIWTAHERTLRWRSLDADRAPVVTLQCDAPIKEAGVAPNGRDAVTVDDLGHAALWHRRGETWEARKVRWKPPAAVFLSPNGDACAYYARDKSVQVFRLPDGKPLSEVMMLGYGPPGSTPFSPDGQRLLLLDRSTSSLLTRQPPNGTGRFVRRRPIRHYRPGAAVFTVDCRRLITAGGDIGVRIWDVETGRLLRELGDRNAGSHLALSPDNRLLVTSGRDQSAHLWSVDTGRELTAPLRMRATIGHASFDRSGRLLVTCGGGAVQVWDATTGEALSLPDPMFEATAAWIRADGRGLCVVGPGGVALVELPRLALPWRRLQEAAELLAGRHLDEGSRLLAYTVTRPETAWDTLRRLVAPPSPAVLPHGDLAHRQALEGAEARRDWSGVVSHVEWLLEREPHRPEHLLCRARALAEQAEWRSAAADYGSYVGLRRGEYLPWHYLALCRLMAGDRPGYEVSCAAMLQDLRDTPEPRHREMTAWAYALGAQSASEVETPLALTRALLQEHPKHPSYLATEAVLLHRAGRHGEAIAQLREAIRLRGEAEPLEPLFLALAHAARGERREAEQAWSDGLRLLEDSFAALAPEQITWDTRAEVELVLREGRGLGFPMPRKSRAR
ncbi:MAG: High-affnity carbon uptake protein Hat/HatR, partial [Armatimonadetes bacterium]|nr:High-affnity carbon uptake protein Hat/HatR [Armatimonadota bacterium]